MVIQTIRKKRPLPARQLAEMYDVTPRTIMRWAAQTRADWIDEQAAGREAIRAYHDDDGHSWTQTAKHFHLSLSTVKERAYRARKERAAEAEEKARDHFDGTVEAGECRFCAFDARNREHHAQNAGKLF